MPYTPANWLAHEADAVSSTHAGSRNGDSSKEVPASSPATKRLRPPGLLELEELLGDHLDTRVSVTMTAKRGKVMIEFSDLTDLERIYRQMTDDE